MATIEIFKDDRFGQVRIQMDASCEPLFCANDICAALGFSNSRDAVSNHVDSDDVAKCDIIDNLGRTQKTTFINESGLYSLIFGSKLEKAREFKKWVTSEVLPSIRKTGSYSVKTEDVNQTISGKQSNVRDKIAVAKFLSSYLNLNDSSKLIIAKSIADPLGLPTPDYTPSKGILKSASELLSERGMKISAQVFNKKAIEKGYLCELERNSTHGQKKRFKSITNKGLSFGENQVNPNNPKSTQPLWYEDKFNELMCILELA